MKVKEVIDTARHLLEGHKATTQIELSLKVYIDRKELSHPYEAPHCLYLACYEITDCTEVQAESAFDAYANYGCALRDNTFFECVSLGEHDYNNLP